MYSLKNNTFRVAAPIENPVLKLPPGFYYLEHHDGMMASFTNFHIVKKDPSLIRFTSGTVGDIITKVENFLELETHAKYNVLGIPHQMGILLHGPPGTGKTSVCRLIIQEAAVKYGSIGIDMSNVHITDIGKIIKLVRSTNPNNPIILMIDEFEEYIENYHTSQILHFLDGSMREDKIVVLTCTNFLHKIEDRIKRRKSRIKHLYLVDSLPLEVYKEFIKSKIKEIDSEDINKFSLLAEEKRLNIDQTKHAIIDYYISGDSMEDAVTINSKFDDNG